MTSDELDRRLQRIAPAVDDTAALAALHGARRGRAPVVVAVAAALAMVAVAALLVTRGGPGHTTKVAVGPSSSSVDNAPPFTASTTVDGIELTVTLDVAKVVVGTRVHAHVVVRNNGTVPVYWAHGGSCLNPAAVVMLPTGKMLTNHEPAAWDGTEPLNVWLPPADNLEQIQFVELGSAGVRTQACLSDLQFGTIEPGGETAWNGVADARVGALPSAALDLMATFTGYTNQGDYPGSPRPPVQLRVAIPMADDAARASSVDDAIASFASDPRVQTFVDTTRHQFDNNPIPVTQSWTTELSWWQGGWEFWVAPYFTDGGITALRLRYDPAANSIVDARITSLTNPPGDDPDHNSFPGQPPDTILK